MLERSRRVALLIDYDNLQICATRDTPGRDLQLEPVVHLAQKYGTVIVARAYAEWNLSTERLAVYKAGIEPAFAPVLRTENDRSGKSLADTVMVAEGMDILWTQFPDVIVLATSDKDLIPLVRVAKQRGAKVVVIGSDLTAIPLREMADEHVTYKQLINDAVLRYGEFVPGRGPATPPEPVRRAARDRDRDREPRVREPREARPAPATPTPAAPAAAAPAALSPAGPAPSPVAPVIPSLAGVEGDGVGRRRRRRGSRRRGERGFGEDGVMIEDGAPTDEDGAEAAVAEPAALAEATPEPIESPLEPSPAVAAAPAEVAPPPVLGLEADADVVEAPNGMDETPVTVDLEESLIPEGAASPNGVEQAESATPVEGALDGETPEGEAPPKRTRARRVASASPRRTRRATR